VPRLSKVAKKLGCTSEDKLFRLNVLEEDDATGRVKVSYVGYGSECDEWKGRDEIVVIESESDGECAESEGVILQLQPLNLFQVFATNIKSSLVSARKGNPCCRINMPFDCIYFEGLKQRGVLRSSLQKNCYKHIYTLAKLNDILGHRWYIRGLNKHGDFCFVNPSSVQFCLQSTKGIVDYQVSSNGTIWRGTFGSGYRLIFNFVRADGTLA